MGVLLSSTSSELLTLGVILLTLIYYYLKSTYKFWKKRGVKYVEPTPILGNTKDMVFMRKSVAEVFKELYDTYPEEPYVGIFEMVKPALLLRDPEIIRHVMVKDFNSFQDRGTPFDEKLDPLSAHLLFLKGADWRNLRSKLTPTFTSGKMKMMFHLMNECAEQLKVYLEKPAKNGQILEMKEVMAKFTTDIIGSCAFGLQFNAIKDEDSEFRKMGRRIFEPSVIVSLRRLIRSVCPVILKLLRVKALPEDITNFFLGAVKETVEFREKNNVVRKDFMQLLIEIKNKGKIDDDGNGVKEGVNGIHHDTEFELTDTRLAAQAFIFFLAGFETSSTALSFALYELALNPDIQEKLRGDIDSALKKNGGEMSYEVLQSIPYLDMVVDESLRKYPPANLLARSATTSYVIPGTSLELEKGMKVLIPVYGLHHDPKYFPNPEKFNPENFSEEAKAARPHYTFMPFGEGPRNCIGMRFGLLQTKLGLATLLSNYEFSVCEKTTIPLKIDPKQFITSSTTGSVLRITKRKT